MLTHAGASVHGLFPDIMAEARNPVVAVRKAEHVEIIRRRRDELNQDVSFGARPFILCGLPIRSLPQGTLKYVRRNGRFFLEIVGHPDYGVPFGQDRLILLWLATMAASKVKGAITFRLIFFLPYILADVAAGIIWRFVYDGDFGLVGGIAHALNLPSIYPIADKNLAIYAILGVVVWKYFGFHMMLFIAGLQTIDKSLLEAAEIDGATPRQRFFRVTLPLLGSTVRLSIFFAVVGSLLT